MQGWPRTGCSTVRLKVRMMVLPDTFIDQDSPNAMYARQAWISKSIGREGVRSAGAREDRRVKRA